jgi:hypothetical protein
MYCEGEAPVITLCQFQGNTAIDARGGSAAG